MEANAIALMLKRYEKDNREPHSIGGAPPKSLEIDEGLRSGTEMAQPPGATGQLTPPEVMLVSSHFMFLTLKLLAVASNWYFQ